MKIFIAGLALLAVSTSAQATTEKFHCGETRVILWTAQPPRTDTGFALEKSDGNPGKALPARLFRWDNDSLYYRGKRCENAPLSLPPKSELPKWDPPRARSRGSTSRDEISSRVIKRESRHQMQDFIGCPSELKVFEQLSGRTIPMKVQLVSLPDARRYGPGIRRGSVPTNHPTVSIAVARI